ncbi:nucleoside-diphosphate-sugar epimerase/pimeloyl-ACP methyl ester carboxylesterase [Paenibacillus turicensis]|uniref:Nucleoside-diphosphate-sugar epimerase/pimeloyl-ACP methyl ester carboxylesterase n=1 Tax=Paenibacillus turicensis TaxID=160487 RepID=A0ABS4FVF9_9BACL|nr:alpha/beta fold hydrolase [Paenibacillus turicensis]MBP1906505.1 nucleoside-diphosphate-sugar epimerase/pimeloyl-ACP methyl ester carboxylesterase [Paenibacillus turicensis]
MNIFLTGGTGFIGRHLLPELASEHQVYVLVRQKSRLDAIVNQLPTNQQPNILPVIGDLTKPRLGLDDTSYKQMLTTDLIIHAGGPMDIGLSLSEAEQSFLYPARSLVQLAKDIDNAKGLKHFIHLSGFMSPYHEQNALSDMDHVLDKEPPYEKMKFLADSYIRKSLHAMNIPLSTVNPSVVVGNSFSGETEQLGGLSILIDAVRRNLMPLVPGGDDYWLPMVHVDHVASFIAKLADTEGLSSNTYYLLDSKQASPSIRALIQLIAKELRTAKPFGTVSFPLLKTILGMGFGKLLGIPKESMNFLVKSEFPIDTKLEIEQLSKIKFSIVPSTLPFIVSDLDYRLNHLGVKRQESFSQQRRTNLISLEKDTHGIPVIFLHGTFSGADALLPIAESLSDINTWFIDLPGFGRTPYHHEPSVIEGYVDSVAAMIIELNKPVILVGHSFGGLIAARVMQRQPSLIHQLIMLQPVLHPIKPKYKIQGVTKLILKYMKPAKLKRELLKNKNFVAPSKYLEDYVHDVVRDLKSPRIRTTNATVMSSLTESKSIQLDPKKWDETKVNILWGDMDKEYHIPKSYEHLDIAHIPYGHQFPIERPEQTAHWIRQVLKV